MNESTPVKEPIDKSDLVKHFEAGDLLFGLENEARALYYEIIRLQLSKSDSTILFITVDDINKELSAEYMFGAEAESPKNKQTQYNAFAQRHLDSWKAHKKFAPKMITEKGEARADKAFIYSCKVALLTHSSKIHFCLDFFQPEAIRNKAHDNYKSYTSKELRLCAKNWEQVKNRVVFYMDGMRCSPPWGEREPLEWLNDKSSMTQSSDLDQSSPLPEASLKTPPHGSQNFFKMPTSISPDSDITETSQESKKDIDAIAKKKLDF
ncbi:MAG: hypothetical protein K2X50_06815 [Gammaproteobacteria bacterium]|nr:hypothetical protein [Gammaproteobacteria bacterium]